MKNKYTILLCACLLSTMNAFGIESSESENYSDLYATSTEQTEDSYADENDKDSKITNERAQQLIEAYKPVLYKRVFGMWLEHNKSVEDIPGEIQKWEPFLYAMATGNWENAEMAGVNWLTESIIMEWLERNSRKTVHDHSWNDWTVPESEMVSLDEIVQDYQNTIEERSPEQFKKYRMKTQNTFRDTEDIVNSVRMKDFLEVHMRIKEDREGTTEYALRGDRDFGYVCPWTWVVIKEDGILHCNTNFMDGADTISFELTPEDVGL